MREAARVWRRGLTPSSSCTGRRCPPRRTMSALTTGRRGLVRNAQAAAGRGAGVPGWSPHRPRCLARIPRRGCTLPRSLRDNPRARPTRRSRVTGTTLRGRSICGRAAPPPPRRRGCGSPRSHPGPPGGQPASARTASSGDTTRVSRAHGIAPPPRASRSVPTASSKPSTPSPVTAKPRRSGNQSRDELARFPASQC